MTTLTKFLTTQSGKKLFIFDNVFTASKKIFLKNFADELTYKTNGYTSKVTENKGNFFYSSYNEEVLNKFGFFNDPNVDYSQIFEIIGQKKLLRSWMLLNNQSTKIHYHIDGPSFDKPCISLLYYVNLEWNESWGGETLFADEFGEPEFALSYKPGRLVLFDSSILHKSAFISLDAPTRYSFNCVFESY